MIFAPIIAFWAVMLVGLLSSRPILIYAYFICGAFGALSVAPTALTGGITLLPQTMCAIMLTLWTLRLPQAGQEMLAALLDVRQFGLLALFVIYVCVGAYVLPRVFEGSVLVYALRGGENGAAPLTPSTQNFTQSAYLVASMASALTFLVLVRRPDLRAHVFGAVLAGGVTLIATGIADLVTQGTDVLAPFRTATYALLTDVEVMNAKRVVGLMPEASAFGPVCVGVAALLYFTRREIAGALSRRLILPGVFMGLIVMAAMSTSSTAYVSLVAFALIALGWRLLSQGPSLGYEIVEDLALVFLFCVFDVLLAIFNPEVLSNLWAYFDELVLKKTASDSYAVRSDLNAMAIEVFKGSAYWGVGAGSQATSGWLYALLSMSGIAGTALMALFLCQTALRRCWTGSDKDQTLVSGAKCAALLSLVSMMLSSSNLDIGQNLAILLGMIVGASRQAATTSAAPLFGHVGRHSAR